MVYICPVDLEYCSRVGCAGGHCRKSGETALNPCNGCGALVVIRGIGICVDCPAAETNEPQEA